MRTEATEKYLREKLSKYSKATIIEAIFQKFAIVDNDSAEGMRVGGFGSTRK